MAVGSFSAGLSGLAANAEALSVIGNNLANLNTVGFKSSSVTFEDLVYQNVGGSTENPTQIGLGTGIAQITPIFAQGTIESSRVATNVAIQGNGFFMLEGPQGASYTRAGNFAFDRNGDLVTPDGQKVLGYTTVDPVTKEIIATGEPTFINVPPGLLRPPIATSQFSMITNLNAAATTGTTFTSQVELVDSLGATHVGTMTYSKTGSGAWSYALTADGAEVTGGTAGTPYSLATGSLGFDATGVLTSVDGGAPDDVAIVTPAWTNGAAASNISWQLLDANDNPVLTGFSSPSATSSTNQNGTRAGTVANVIVNPDGTIVAQGYGQAVVIAQLALANFNNPAGLTKLGSNRFGDYPAAGIRSIGVPGSGGRGSIVGSALEQSNVDMAREFTNMIIAQRGYQASSKIITVSDELLQETLNLKR
jgi:flagellar hook protein FlgE